MELNRDFAEFCVKNILNTARLVTTDGRTWELKESIGGVSRGESFTSLDACARAMVSALWAQYQQARGKAAA